MSHNISHIRYNLLNLPDSVIFADGNMLTFIYMADGRRVGTDSHTGSTPLVFPGIGGHGGPQVQTVEYRGGDVTANLSGFNRLEIPGGYLTFGREFYQFTPSQGGGLSFDGEWTRGLASHFYVTDYLGSVVAVCSGETGAVEQTASYMPSGVVFSSTNYGTQPYKFCGKEDITMHGFNMYDSFARYQYSRFPRFTTMDPMAEWDYATSPYAYCRNDFVNLVDPNGEDAYVFNSQGRLIDTSRYGIWRYQDCFVVVNDDGTLSWGPVFDLGTFVEYGESLFPQSYEGGGSYGYYKFSDYERAKKVYEFLANNTSSEWSHYVFLNNESYMLTSFDQREERAGSFFLYKYHGDNLFKSLSHSHPGNTAYPSGISVYNMGNGKDNDMKLIYWFVDTFGYEPNFYIYIPSAGTYIQYSSHSKATDFRDLFFDLLQSNLPF